MQTASAAHRQFAVSETRRRLTASLTVLVVGGALFGIAAAPGLDGLWFFAFCCWFMVAAVVGIWAWWPVWNQSSDQKADVVSAMASFYGDLEYLPHPNLDLHRYRRWGVLPDFDARWARDQIRGSRARIPFSATEVTLLRRSRRTSSSGSQSVPFFQGLFVEVRLPSKVSSKTVFGTVGEFLGIFAPGVSKLESFGKWSAAFEVRSTARECEPEKPVEDQALAKFSATWLNPPTRQAQTRTEGER